MSKGPARLAAARAEGRAGVRPALGPIRAGWQSTSRRGRRSYDFQSRQECRSYRRGQGPAHGAEAGVGLKPDLLGRPTRRPAVTPYGRHPPPTV